MVTVIIVCIADTIHGFLCNKNPLDTSLCNFYQLNLQENQKPEINGQYPCKVTTTIWLGGSVYGLHHYQFFFSFWKNNIIKKLLTEISFTPGCVELVKVLSRTDQHAYGRFCEQNVISDCAGTLLRTYYIYFSNLQKCNLHQTCHCRDKSFTIF